jgi:hypothetical protein
VLAVVVGAVAAFCIYRQIGEEIRCHAETMIARHYPNMKVHLRSAELVEGKGIHLHDLSIVDPSIEGPSAELFHVEEAFLECPTDWKELMGGNPQIRRVTVRRPTLRVTRLADGSWSTARLLPLPKFEHRPPDVEMEDGVIEIIDGQLATSRKLELREVSLSIVPQEDASADPAIWARRLRGTLLGDNIRKVDFDGIFDPHGLSCSIRGQIEGLAISPELRDTMPEPLASKLAELGDLRGQGDFGFQVNCDPAAVLPIQFDISGRLLQGRIDDVRMPHALTDISAGVHIHNGGFTIDNLKAKSGRASLQMSCRRTGFNPDSPLWLKAEARQLELDRTLLDLLPPSMQALKEELQDQWSKYSPAGLVDADVQLTFDGKVWKPEISTRCLDVSLTHYHFPYRLDHGRGTLDLKNNLLTLNLKASGGGRPVVLTAEITNPLHGATGKFEAKGEDLPLDEALIAAVPEKPREVVRSFDPRGTVSIYARTWRDKPDEPLHQHYRLDVSRCTIRYEKFPYPLTNVCGTLEMFDGNWTFRNIEGANKSARVHCEGHFTPGLQGNELVLKIVGREVPLEEDLRDALGPHNPHIRQVWSDMRPRGLVDLTVDVNYLSEQKKFNVGVRVQPLRDTASIEPVHFPYRLERLQGVVLYQDGQITFQRFKAEHGPVKEPVKITAEGNCTFQPDGRWNIHFASLTTERLRADRDLIQALPERLRKVVVELNPTGAVNLRGSFDLERSGQPDEPPHSKWDVRLVLMRNKFQCGGILLENACGEATLAGTFDGKHVQSRGELALDSLSYKDHQFTQVQGPIWMDDGRVLFGAWVDRRENAAVVIQPRTPRPITANIFGGKFFLDGWTTLAPEPRYAFNATLTDADLARCSQEAMTGRQKLRGKILATADVAGSGRTFNNLSGGGTIQLTEGNVYELPVMLSLLKIVGGRQPDQNAFSDGIVNYRIVGPYIYFKNIEFHGDAISLRGSGEMNLQSEIKLTFHALVGRGEIDLPVIKQVFSGASQQLMLLHVSGTLLEPKVSQEALPGVNKALDLFR